MGAPRGRIIAVLVAALMSSAACAAVTPSGPQASSSPEQPSLSPVPGASALPTAAPSGFAFGIEAVVGYYEGGGYVCGEPVPSTVSAGYSYRSCVAEDPQGRTLEVGLVTDPAGELANAFASVQGTADEPILAPIDALDPLAAFLGAMLGEDRGSELLTWLAGHLGDEYAETTSADLVVATYTASEADHSRLYVEIANSAYLEAPAPSSP